MSDLSGLSSIGGTLSALQDTGLREFIETNSGSWTGGETPDLSNYVPYSANSAVLGNDNTGSELGFVIGSGNKGPRQGIAIGQDNKCPYGSCSLLVGGNNSAYDNAAAIGWSSYAGNYSFALGVNAEAKFSKSFALGDYVSARWERDFVLGSQSYASGESLAQVYSAAATQDSLAQGSYISAHRYSLAQGSNSLGSSYSLAQGGNCTAKKYSIAQGATNSAFDYAQTFGEGLLASSQMSIGKWNKTSAGASFVIGDGTYSNRSDSFVIFSDGSVSAKGNISANGVELGAGGDYLTTADSANFYTTANESGFITGVDLTPYQTTAGMTAYIPATVVATSADATGFNILYVVTGE